MHGKHISIFLDGCVSTLVSLEIFSQNVYVHGPGIPLIMCLSTAVVTGAMSHTKPASFGNMEFISSPACQLSLFRVKKSRCKRSTPKHASHVVKTLLYTRRYTSLEIQVTLDNKFQKMFCICDEYVINLFVCIYEVRNGTLKKLLGSSFKIMLHYDVLRNRLKY